MLPLLAAASLAITLPIGQPLDEWSFTGEPELILSNVRLLQCKEGWGTGWIIAKNVLVTANHVAEAGPCKDYATQAKLITYKKDPRHDLALMTGALPDYGEYIRYSCAGFRAGQEYEVYGWSSYGYRDRILRKNRVVATDSFTKPEDKYRDGSSMPSLRRMKGHTVPGMSGGPYTRTGVTYGIVTAGMGWRSPFGYLVRPEVFATDLKDTILCHSP